MQINSFSRHSEPRANLWISKQAKIAKGFSFPWVTYFKLKKKNFILKIKVSNTTLPVPRKPPTPSLSREPHCNYIRAGLGTPRTQEALCSLRRPLQGAQDFAPRAGWTRIRRSSPARARAGAQQLGPPARGRHPPGAHVCGLLSSRGRAAGVSAHQPLLIAGEGRAERAEARGSESALGG